MRERWYPVDIEYTGLVYGSAPIVQTPGMSMLMRIYCRNSLCEGSKRENCSNVGETHVEMRGRLGGPKEKL